MLTIIVDTESLIHLRALLEVAEVFGDGAPDDRKEAIEEAIAWAKRATNQPPADALATISQEVLDDLVHDCLSNEASEINNRGRDEQIRFLIENGYTVADILRAED
jgi:hypothetical protein